MTSTGKKPAKRPVVLCNGSCRLNLQSFAYAIRLRVQRLGSCVLDVVEHHVQLVVV